MRVSAKLACAAVGAVASAASLVAVAAPASAATATCGASGYYCFFVRTDYTPTSSGYRIRFQTTTFDNFANYPAAEGPTGNFQDNVESMANTGSRSICVYNNGTRIYRHLAGVDVANYGGYNNTFDYWKTSTGTTC